MAPLKCSRICQTPLICQVFLETFNQVVVGSIPTGLTKKSLLSLQIL